MLDGAREDRGRGVPLTDEERAERHYEQYGTYDLPPRGTGLSTGKLKISGFLGQMQGNPASIDTSDVVGIISGGALGWYVARRWPKGIVTYIGIIVGAEVGLRLSMLIRQWRAGGV